MDAGGEGSLSAWFACPQRHLGAGARALWDNERMRMESGCKAGCRAA